MSALLCSTKCGLVVQLSSTPSTRSTPPLLVLPLRIGNVLTSCLLGTVISNTSRWDPLDLVPILPILRAFSASGLRPEAATVFRRAVRAPEPRLTRNPAFKASGCCQTRAADLSVPNCLRINYSASMRMYGEDLAMHCAGRC